MRLPSARGPLSEALVTALTRGRSLPDTSPATSPDPAGDPLADEDVQLTLWVLHELHYADFDDVEGDREWDPGLVALRTTLTDAVERSLREACAPRVQAAREAAAELPEQVFMMTKEDDGPSLASFLHRHADRTQYAEFMAHRSVVALKESDAVAWLLPRLRGEAKTVLAELLYDEFGGGQPARLHARLYAEAMAGCGLDPSYGHYADRLPATSLAVDNVGSMLGLSRRLRGAALGHFAAFEATSSLPCRKFAGGAERLGLPIEVRRYWDEHVEADAVHEQLAVRGACGALAADEPALADDVLWGAAACLEVEARFGSAVLAAFEDGRSSWREENP